MIGAPFPFRLFVFAGSCPNYPTDRRRPLHDRSRMPFQAGRSLAYSDSIGLAAPIRAIYGGGTSSLSSRCPFQLLAPYSSLPLSAASRFPVLPVPLPLQPFRSVAQRSFPSSWPSPVPRSLAILSDPPCSCSTFRVHPPPFPFHVVPSCLFPAPGSLFFSAPLALIFILFSYGCRRPASPSFLTEPIHRGGTVRTHLRKNRFRQDNLPSVPCWTPVCRNPLDWKRLTMKIQAWNACKWMEFPVMICN